MKYQKLIKKIYEIPYTILKNASSQDDDLWYILECEKLNKRIWITHDFNKIWNISTAQLDLDCKSREYNNSFKHYNFKNTTKMCEFIDKEFIKVKEND